MNTEDLETLLEGGEETDSLEFKGAMAWDAKSLVRDILAMANVLDGGRIIVGVEDGTFAREGLTEEQVASFIPDVMRDQVAPFADPMVQFRCEIVADSTGKRFAVVEVSPFESIPVICKKSSTDVYAGTVYFRSRSRRPASARVESSADMREIIEAATVRSARRLRRLGYVPEQEPDFDYDSELGGL